MLCKLKKIINCILLLIHFAEITVNPLLFKKGDAKLALYGMSHVKDERLHRLFRENSVKLLRPEEDTDSWFNILVLHQNRNPYGGWHWMHVLFTSFFHKIINHFLI